MKQVENGDNRHEGSCNGGLMTNYSPINEKALQIAEKSQMIDSKEISKLFKKFKERGILKEPIEINLEKNRPKIKIRNHKNCKDYIDQFIYYRKLRGYTQEQVGQVIGISGKGYSKYESRMYEFKDKNKIDAIAKFLEIDEELKMLPIYTKIDKQQLRNFLIKNNISNTEFSKKIGVSRRSIVDWFNKETKISDESYKKINDFILNFEKNKIYENQIEDEEEL